MRTYPNEKESVTLEVGTNGNGEVVVNHPDLHPDANGVGHIVFSPRQARGLANLLNKKAREADKELDRQVCLRLRKLLDTVKETSRAPEDQQPLRAKRKTVNR